MLNHWKKKHVISKFVTKAFDNRLEKLEKINKEEAKKPKSFFEEERKTETDQPNEPQDENQKIRNDITVLTEFYKSKGRNRVKGEEENNKKEKEIVASKGKTTASKHKRSESLPILEAKVEKRGGLTLDVFRKERDNQSVKKKTYDDPEYVRNKYI